MLLKSDSPFNQPLLNMKKSGNHFVKKFEGADRESWPLPPSSVFKCKDATPWINPNLFYSGIIIVGDVISEEPDQGHFKYLDDDTMYAELEHHSVFSSKKSTRIVEYSPNQERGIDPGVNGVDDYSRRKSAVNPVAAEFQQAIRNENSVPTRIINRANGHRGSDFDGNVLIRFKEVSDSAGSSEAGSTSKKKKKWLPFKKEQSQSSKLFY